MQTLISLIRKEGLAFLLLGAVLALIITPAVLAPQYTVKQGAYSATIEQINTGASMVGRPVIKALVEDQTDRQFWVTLPSTEPLREGDAIEIGVLCQTDAFEKCTALYLSPMVDEVGLTLGA